MKWFALLVLSFTMLLSPGQASADELVDALLACSVLDYGKALPTLLKLSDEGVRDAQTRLGIMYLHGAGVSVDLREAAKWLTLSAEAGSTEALLELAEARRGLGSEEDFNMAFYWLRKAADRDIAEAYALVGELYLFGQGQPQDYMQARRWFEKGAHAFDSKAFYYLGLMYSSGLGVSPDQTEAMKWFELAWSTSPFEAVPAEVSAAYQNYREKLMPAQMAKANQAAKDWVRNHNPG